MDRRAGVDRKGMTVQYLDAFGERNIYREREVRGGGVKFTALAAYMPNIQTQATSIA